MPWYVMTSAIVVLDPHYSVTLTSPVDVWQLTSVLDEPQPSVYRTRPVGDDALESCLRVRRVRI